VGSKERVHKVLLNVIGLDRENFKPRRQTYHFLALECHFRHDCAFAERSRHKPVFVTIIHSEGQYTTRNRFLIQVKDRSAPAIDAGFTFDGLSVARLICLIAADLFDSRPESILRRLLDG
jgi:hypothetical protein